jgi:hypothetical protein
VSEDLLDLHEAWERWGELNRGWRTERTLRKDELGQDQFMIGATAQSTSPKVGKPPTASISRFGTQASNLVLLNATSIGNDMWRVDYALLILTS